MIRRFLRWTGATFIFAAVALFNVYVWQVVSTAAAWTCKSECTATDYLELFARYFVDLTPHVALIAASAFTVVRLGKDDV